MKARSIRYKGGWPDWSRENQRCLLLQRPLLFATVLCFLSLRSKLTAVVTTMTPKYRVVPDKSKFLVTHNGDEIVDVCNTVQDAKRKIAVCKRDDFMWDTARLLVSKAVKAHMKIHAVDRRTSRHWIREAAD